MKSTILVSILCGVTAGAVGGYLATPTGQPAQSTDAHQDTKPDDIHALTRANDAIRALQKQVDGLESKLQDSLRRQAQTGNSRATARAQTSGMTTPTTTDTKAQKAPFEGLDTWMSEAIRQDASPIRTAVLEMVQDEMKNRGAEWRTFARARREARDERKLNELVEKVDISAAQRDDLLQMLTAEREEIWGARREARKTLDFGSLREKVDTMRNETDEKVAEILNPDQLEEWTKMRKDMQRRRRF